MAPTEIPSPLTYRQRVWFAAVLTALGLAMLLANLVGCAPSCSAVPGHREVPAVAQLRESGGATCTMWRATWDLAVTAGHCCADPSQDLREGPGPGALPGAEVSVVLVSEKLDVCVLRAQMLGEPIALAESDPEVGDPVWTAGWPSGHLAISSGYWGGRTEDERGFVTLAIAPGESGAPVLDWSGRAVGMVVSLPMIRVGGNPVPVTSMGWAAPLEAIRSQLTRARAIVAGQVAPGAL